MRTFMAVALLSVEPDPKGDPGRALVAIRLSCGCETRRRVDRSRILETIEADGSAGRLVAGKFACESHP